MSENTTPMPPIKQIRQVPVWTPDAEFKLTGTQFMALQNHFSIYAEPLAIMQDLLNTGLNSGVIQVRYQDPEGNEIPKQEVEDYIAEMKSYQDSLLNKATEEIVGTDTTSKKLKKTKQPTETA